MAFNIYNYTDYRKALSDFYYSEKERNSAVSHRYIAQKMGFASSGFFSQVIQGKSNIAEKNIEKFANLLKLNSHESAYFETLVLYNQAKTPEIKKQLFTKLRSFNPEKVKDLNYDDYLFYDKWYYSAIHELLDFFPFDGENYTDLAHTLYPPITTYDAQQAITLLKELQLIRLEDGFYKKVDRLLTSSNKNSSQIVTNYALNMIERGKLAIEDLDKSERSISWLTMSISDETYGDIVEELRTFRRKIMQMVSADDKANRVYQMNFQLFPLSDRYDSNKGVQ